MINLGTFEKLRNRRRFETSMELNKQQELVDSSMEKKDPLCISQLKISSSHEALRSSSLPHAKMTGELFKSHRLSVSPKGTAFASFRSFEYILISLVCNSF